MNNPTVKTDALVMEHDFAHIKDAINAGDMMKLVTDLSVQEPELAVGVSSLYTQVLELLKETTMPRELRDRIAKRVSLAIWVPLLAQRRAHRREWDSFLPSLEPVVDAPEASDANDATDLPDVPGILVGLDVTMMRLLLPDWTDEALLQLLEQNGPSIAAAMLKAGASMAVELSGAKGGER